MEVLAHEGGEVVQAFCQDVHRVARDFHDFLVVPNLRVELLLLPFGIWLEEFPNVIIIDEFDFTCSEIGFGFLGPLYGVCFLKNVDADEACTSSKLRRSILQEGSLIQLEFQNLESNVGHCWVLVITEKSQVSLHALHWSWKVEIEAKFLNDVLLELDELAFGDVLSLLIWEQVDHSIEAGRNRLLQLCSHEYADHCQMEHLGWPEVLRSDHHDVVIENACSHEEAFWFVTFLLMK